MQEQTKKCPYCYNEIAEQAIKCSYCGEWLKDENRSLSCGIGFKNPIVIVLSVIVLVCFCIMQVNTNDNTLNTFLFVFVIFGICGYVYLLPSIVAVSKKHPQTFSIIVVNLLLGETLVGWIVSMIWANSHRLERHTHW